MQKKLKYIIDTDIGDDIDDAFAVAFAANAGLNLIGITTVFRNSVQRARMTKRLLALCGRTDIPVYAGVDQPFVQRIENLLPKEMIEKEMAKGYYELPQYMPEMDAVGYNDDRHAVDFIIESAEKYGKELVLIPIGPFTNIAMAIRKAPEIMKNVGEIRLIGGFYFQDVPEWNVACDPEAARILYTFGIPIKAVGIDITTKCPLSQEDVADLRRACDGGNALICRMMDKWFAHYGQKAPIMHDPLVIASILDDGVVGYEDKYVLIGLEGAQRCKTVVEDAPSPLNAKISVGTAVDSGKFVKLFKQYIG
ncbi:ribosylpyrimidine nucleosidase [Clostridia bacterium]|nr:ribosylpyrimidine nucleosidase [Clostridia bacterium]